MYLSFSMCFGITGNLSIYFLNLRGRERERVCEAFWEDWISKVGKETVFMAGCAKYYVFT